MDDPAGKVLELPAAAESGEIVEGLVATATRAALDEVGRLASPAGASALLLAGLLDGGGYNAAGAAALAKAHRETLESALKGAPKANDAVDELLSRRMRSG